MVKKLSTGKPKKSVGVRAIPDHCRKCKLAIWLVTWYGMKYELDIEPLTPETELGMVLADISTWQLKPGRPTFEIDYRSVRRVIENPASQVVVLNTHYCRDKEMIQLHPQYFEYKSYEIPDNGEIPF